MTDLPMTDLPMTDAAITLRLRAYVKLLRATRAIQAAAEPRIAAAGLTMTQLGVLEALHHKGPLTQRALIRKVLTSPGNMTAVVDKLEAAGLVVRQPCPEDRRSVYVVLTREGATQIAALFPRHAEDIARAMAGLDEADIARLDGLLRTLGRHAEAAAGAEAPLAEPPEPAHLAP